MFRTLADGRKWKNARIYEARVATDDIAVTKTHKFNFMRKFLKKWKIIIIKITEKLPINVIGRNEALNF